jgi:hypothetical protein
VRCFEDTEHRALNVSPDTIQRAHVGAAFLSFVGEVLDGAQHALLMTDRRLIAVLARMT